MEHKKKESKPVNSALFLGVSGVLSGFYLSLISEISVICGLKKRKTNPILKSVKSR